MAEVERALNAAQVRVEATQHTFDQIVARMATDFARFQVPPPNTEGYDAEGVGAVEHPTWKLRDLRVTSLTLRLQSKRRAMCS